MDQILRQSIQTNTFYYFVILMVLTTISQLSTMMVIVFGNISGKELLVAASVVGPNYWRLWHNTSINKFHGYHKRYG